MDISMATSLIAELGFPIACVVMMGCFVFYLIKKTSETNATNMTTVQARCQKREEKLYDEIAKNREVNAEAIRTITLCVEKLNTIQNDIGDIKSDVTILKAKVE